MGRLAGAIRTSWLIFSSISIIVSRQKGGDTYIPSEKAESNAEITNGFRCKLTQGSQAKLTDAKPVVAPGWCILFVYSTHAPTQSLFPYPIPREESVK